MQLSLYQLANLALLIILLVLLFRFLWITFLNPFSRPESWREAVRSRQVSYKLIRIERFYADKVRFHSFWIQVRRLERGKVQGAFAEVGIYRGESAKIIHLMAPGRTFFLFDTFSGFPAADLEGETGKAAAYTTGNFADTSLSRVIRRIGRSSCIVPCPGYFPDSAEAVSKENFALVSLDADLYKPTRAGLEFFYPRLTPGGVILVHDYNYKWPGVVRAVDEFVCAIPEIPVLVPDREGTLIIIKELSN